MNIINHYTCLFVGAETGTRTRDLLITNELLYQLSYFGLFSESGTKVIIFLNIGTLLLSFL